MTVVLALEIVDRELGGADGVGDIYLEGLVGIGVDCIDGIFEVPEIGPGLFWFLDIGVGYLNRQDGEMRKRRR